MATLPCSHWSSMTPMPVIPTACPRAGGWYSGLRMPEGKRAGPDPYVVQGKNVWLTTLSVPITANSKFYGVVGADFDISFIQETRRADVHRPVWRQRLRIDPWAIKGWWWLTVNGEGRGRPTAERRTARHLGQGAGQCAEDHRDSRQARTHRKSVQMPSITLGRSEKPWAMQIPLARRWS